MARVISDLTTDELQEMIETAIDRKLTEWLGDPDEGKQLRPDLVERIQRQREEYAQGKRGRTLAEVRQRLGLD